MVVDRRTILFANPPVWVAPGVYSGSCRASVTVGAAYPPRQAFGGLYWVLVLLACFIAASASLAVSSVVVSKRENAPVAAADNEQAPAAVLSGNSQIATPSYSPKAIDRH